MALFHMFANGKKKKNTITSLQTEGEENLDKEAIEKEIICYFQDLYSKNPPRNAWFTRRVGKTLDPERRMEKS